MWVHAPFLPPVLSDLTNLLPHLFIVYRIVTLSFAPFLVVHINPAYTRVTGLSPADILGKPFHEVIEDPTCKANTAKASTLTGLHEKVTSFARGGSKDADNNNKFSVHVSVVGPEPSERPSYLEQKNFTHYMISLEEHQKPKEAEEVMSVEEMNTAVLDLDFLLPVAVSPTREEDPSDIPVLPILDLPSTMRLHCGVMG